ncbi:MAG: type II CRISPR RNA-guided endonuclease Cas9 [Fibrobacter sp.]|nr:type II CRISPR RNA-guided endonuclease Cas9 [Fibrobacter sp.]MBP5441260.1 type II CRISPR RNA-guided endonuclease Cas9 [Fibrobacter sp.]
MKKILGLDLGTNSIGWAVVKEAEKEGEKSSIVKLGVRTISFDNFVNTVSGKTCMDAVADFNGGKGISCNAGRTQGRSMRRNLQRYKLRRDFLRKTLKEHGFIDDSTILAEKGNNTTFETYRLRAKAATEKVSLTELARILLMINKKRGYKSNRKAKSSDEGSLIDGMAIAEKLYKDNITPGQFVLSLYNQGKRYEPDFYPSDLQAEFDRIWNFQKNSYPEILTDSLKSNLLGKNKSATWAICKSPFNIVGIKRNTKGFEQKKEDYEWRVQAISEKIGLEELAIVLQNINGQKSGTSNYLGNIGDRSKELRFNHITVGQFQMNKLAKNPNYSLKNQVFYRQDYLDEFETIWETQAKFHPELTPALKQEIRDVVIFYQRPLKSQKNLISVCELEGRKVSRTIDGKRKEVLSGPKVVPISSPIFQEFRLWQTLNNVNLTNKETGEFCALKQEEKEKLFAELNIKEQLNKADALKVLFGKEYQEYDLNFDKLEGNRTQAKLFNAYSKIIKMNGFGENNFSKMNAKDILNTIKSAFKQLKIKTDFLTFDATLANEEFENQLLFKLWHLLYSFQGDKTPTGNGNLIQKIQDLCQMDRDSASVLAGITFEDAYGSLSAKAIKKILPFLKQGQKYSDACTSAGYKHSKRSLTREELANKVYKDHLDALPMNSLRNPVVEKILNQMVNVVNTIIDTYGKPDEVRIELARELKKNAKEREEMAASIKEISAKYEEYRKILINEFGIEHPSRNDLLRYRLYRELESNGFHTLYSNTYIPAEKLFSKEFDIEHIISQARRFDDSFANKTLEARQINIEKSNSTALDFVASKYGEKGVEQYKSRINKMHTEGENKISNAKYKNLLMHEADIPSGFIERDLRDSQYIAKKAREMLEDVVKFVVPTTGSITERLREDWQLVDVMQELDWDKYNKQGLTETYKDKDGRTIRKIIDWTKRNDHRHHAMDALTIAFTKRSYIQYLNNLNARVPKSEQEYIDLNNYDLNHIDPADVKRIEASIEQKELYRNDKGKLCFIPPMPLDEFRAKAKEQLENTLISIKARNKVVTRNTNISKGKDGKTNHQHTLTPRGQLHNESIYGSYQAENVKQEKIDAKFTAEKIATVCNSEYRNALLERLKKFDGDSKKAFAGKNAVSRIPIFLDEMHTRKVPETVTTKTYERVYTIRKAISSQNFKDVKTIDKVIDEGIKNLLLERFAEYNNDAKKAFDNLAENPIWLNKEKGISIKNVTIRAVNNAVALHNGHDFVNTSNNHHVAIFRDSEGTLQEHIISFYEATQRAVKGLPIVDKDYKKEDGWQFLFTMKQNEFFVFPNQETGFDPNKIDLTDTSNYKLISPNLFRVQKFTTKDYFFRHHHETILNDNKKLLGTTWKRGGLSLLNGVVKVRINHIGQIVSVGEY